MYQIWQKLLLKGGEIPLWMGGFSQKLAVSDPLKYGRDFPPHPATYEVFEPRYCEVSFPEYLSGQWDIYGGQCIYEYRK